MPRLQTIMALNYAALCMQNQARTLKGVTRLLTDELERQVLPDGGHASRNPSALIELLLDLLPLRQAFAARNVPPPAALNNAIDRMMPMLRFFRHGDGNFALFNGMGPTRTDLVSTVLAYDDARGTPVANAPHSGYQRVQVGDALLIVDAGPPPPLPLSYEAHAGCLSFELSSKNHRIVVNCGLPATSRETWRHVARASAAHSTVIFNDTSSCRFLTAESLRSLLGAPILSGPADVQVSRQERDNGMTLRLSHDGYASRFGVVHQRTLRLSPDGRRLDGEDVFAPAHGESLPAAPRRQFRGALPPPSAGQGEPPQRRPRRDAGAAQQGGVDVRRLRRTGRAGGKRLSRRPRRAAPLRPDRDLRARPRGAARALDASRTRTRRNRCGAPSRRSRSCRYDTCGHSGVERREAGIRKHSVDWVMRHCVIANDCGYGFRQPLRGFRNDAECPISAASPAPFSPSPTRAA